MQKIFVVEDDDSIREMVSYALGSAGFDVTEFPDANNLLDTLSEVVPSLILLDIMLPGIDGLTILKKMREMEKFKQIPVIMLTAKGSELDRIKGLDLGSDDYIPKPFSVMEVISRVKAVLRRSRVEATAEKEIKLDSIQLSQSKRVVLVDGVEKSLTYKEFELLLCLMTNQGFVLSRESLIEQVWGFDYNGESRTVDMHIKTLRQKLGQAGDSIKTIRNVGYKIGG